MVEAPPSEWPVDRLRAEVESRTWFHTIEIVPGLRTPGDDDTIAKAPHMRIPEDLTGQTVLDIGAYDGFFSFEAERRGAARVLATDDWVWNAPGCDARRNFDLVRDVLGSRVQSHGVSVEALSVAEVGGRFDVVLFLGVLYHAPDPIGYLKNVREVTQGFAIIETVVDLLDVPVPAAAYYAAESLNADGSNHFGPNTAAVEAWLLEAGFRRVVAFPPWHTEPEYAIDVTHEASPARRVRRRLGRQQRSGRQVFHAFV
jgi:tRNA (mo5U34)-methyltransferase